APTIRPPPPSSAAGRPRRRRACDGAGASGARSSSPRGSGRSVLFYGTLVPTLRTVPGRESDAGRPRRIDRDRALARGVGRFGSSAPLLAILGTIADETSG